MVKANNKELNLIIGGGLESKLESEVQPKITLKKLLKDKSERNKLFMLISGKPFLYAAGCVAAQYGYGSDELWSCVHLDGGYVIGLSAECQ